MKRFDFLFPMVVLITLQIITGVIGKAIVYKDEVNERYEEQGGMAKRWKNIRVGYGCEACSCIGMWH